MVLFGTWEPEHARNHLQILCILDLSELQHRPSNTTPRLQTPL